MRIHYHFSENKDLFEKSGDFCLKFGQKAFGYQKVSSFIAQESTIQKVKASAGYIFLFLLTIPLSTILSLAGLGLIALSKSHKEKYAELQKSLTASIPNKQPSPKSSSPVKKQNTQLEKWHETYDKLVKSGKGLREHRIPLYQETKELCEKGYYYIEDEKHHFDQDKTKKMIDQTVSYPLQETLPILEEEDRYNTVIEIVETDTFELGAQYQKEVFTPVGLNMANAFNPGGGVESGCSAQEESLFRRSNYYQALYPQKKHMYPLPEESVIYTPSVQIFRTPETYLNSKPEDRLPGYQFKDISTLDMIACAFPDLRRKHETPDGYEADIRNRIRNILRVAHNQGHDSLVLGAIGCGAFKNDPRIVARVFKKELQSDEFRGRFQKIGFGIIYPDIKFKRESLNLIDIFRAELGYTIPHK